MSGRLICAFGLPARAKGSASLHRPEWLREEGWKVEGAGGCRFGPLPSSYPKLWCACGHCLATFPAQFAAYYVTMAFTAVRLSLIDGRRKMISGGDNSQCSVWHKLPENWLDLIHCVAPWPLRSQCRQWLTGYPSCWRVLLLCSNQLPRLQEVVRHFNPFTAPVCNISGLKSARIHGCKQYIWWSYNKPTFNTVL